TRLRRSSTWDCSMLVSNCAGWPGLSRSRGEKPVLRRLGPAHPTSTIPRHTRVAHTLSGQIGELRSVVLRLDRLPTPPAVGDLQPDQFTQQGEALSVKDAHGRNGRRKNV